MLHRFFTFLLCASLALQGAGLALAGEPACPMQAEMQAMALEGDLDSANLSPCCSAPQAMGENSPPCKAGADCRVPLAWMSALDAANAGRVQAADPPAALNSFEPSAPPGAPWRPPAAG